MATETGTATSHLDLLAKLRDFLVANDWEQIGGLTSGTPTNTDYMSFKGIGTGGTDEIFVSLTPSASVAAGYYNIGLRGHTAYNEGSPGVDQAGADSQWVYVLLANTSIPYWFFVNERRFIVVTRVNGRYDSLYGGFLLPEHLPGDWSYPLFIGGSSYSATALASSDALTHSNYWNATASSRTNPAQSTAHMFSPIQAWVPVRNQTGASRDLGGDSRNTIPWGSAFPMNFRRCLDNTPWMQRGQVVGFGYDQNGTAFNEMPEGGVLYGAFDGVYYSPAFGGVAEQVVTDTATSKEYQLFPNVFRTSDSEFVAIEVL